MSVKDRSPAIVEWVTFTKIVYFWFRTTSHSKLVNRINIEDIIEVMYKYYHIKILLKYYESGSNQLYIYTRRSSSSYNRLWFIESNGNIYYVKNCPDLTYKILDKDDNWIINKYAVDKYLHSVYLSQEKCQRLIEILKIIKIVPL